MRHTEKEKLFEKLDRFAKDEIQKRDRQIKSINEQSARQKKKIDTLEEEVLHLQNLLLEEQENKIVLVPSDPLYMLGLTQGQEDKAQSRAKSLLKSLHPDRTQNKDTAFLFDMILKSRDMILKKST